MMKEDYQATISSIEGRIKQLEQERDKSTKFANICSYNDRISRLDIILENVYYQSSRQYYS